MCDFFEVAQPKTMKTNVSNVGLHFLNHKTIVILDIFLSFFLKEVYV